MAFVDVAYTPVPLSVALPRFPDQSTFWGLAYLTFEEGRRTAFTHDKDVVPGQTLHSKQKVEPDAHLACFDDLYFVSAVDGFEWERDVSPGWRFVGVHVRWNKWVEDVAAEMVKRALGVPESGEVPPVSLGESFVRSFQLIRRIFGPVYRCSSPPILTLPQVVSLPPRRRMLSSFARLPKSRSPGPRSASREIRRGHAAGERARRDRDERRKERDVVGGGQ